MEDILIIYQAILLVLKNFFPAFLFVVIGLAYISWDERRDGPGGKALKNENRHNSNMPIM